MSRAIQIDLLLAGLVHPTTGSPVAAGTVYFYSAGTTNPKSVWTEKEETNAHTSYQLSAVGTAHLYGEGNYKLVVKDTNDTTVLTLDNIRLEYPYWGRRTLIQTGSQLSSDDFLLVNTTSGAVTINALAAASWTRPLKVQRIAGANAITFEPSGAETIDSAANLTWSSDSIVEIISDGSNLRTAGFRSSFTDADNDTKIQVEESSDEDIIRFDTGGTERGTIDANGLHAVLADADGDTKIQLEESADEDKVRIDTGGTERVIIDSTGIHASATANDAGAVVTTDATQTLTAKTLASAVLNTGVSGTAVLDEDNMASDSATKLATQQSIKAFVTSGTVTMTNKTLTSPKINEDVALTANSTQINAKANSEAFCTNANGNPNVSDTALDVHTGVAETTWESVGPTGGGKDNTWAALDSVPTDADWIDVKVYSEISDLSTAGNNWILVNARRNGSSEAANYQNIIAASSSYANSSSDSSSRCIAIVKIPVSLRSFDVYWESVSSTNIIKLFLVGYGYNP